MADDTVLLAPVAMHAGAAICEVPGNKRAVWNGQEYYTDGLFYMIEREQHQEAHLRFRATSSEVDARLLIDSYPPRHFLSMSEVLVAVGIPEDQARDMEQRFIEESNLANSHPDGYFTPKQMGEFMRDCMRRSR